MELMSATGNLGDIPSDFSLTYGNGPQIIFLDYNVIRTTGKPSIRLEPHTSLDVNVAREVDGTWYTVNPGDHIVAKCWMRVLTDSSTLGYPQCGARIGIDFYGYVNGVFSHLPADAFWHNYYGGDFSQMYVRDSNGGAWQQKTIDVIVPATATDSAGNVGTVTMFVMWLQGSPWIEHSTASTVWFADAELWINPYEVTPTPTPTVTPTTTPTSTPTATASPTATPTYNPSATPTPTPTYNPYSSPTPTQTPSSPMSSNFRILGLGPVLFMSIVMILVGSLALLSSFFVSKKK